MPSLKNVFLLKDLRRRAGGAKKKNYLSSPGAYRPNRRFKFC